MDEQPTRKPIAKINTEQQYQCPICTGVLDEQFITKSPYPEMPCPHCESIIQIRAAGEGSKDQRGESRCPTTFMVEYRNFGRFIQEYTKNVSKGGMFIRTGYAPAKGSIIELLLHIPEIGQPLKMQAEVVHVQHDEQQLQQRGIGVQFKDIDEQSKKLLVAFIATLKDCS